MPALTPSWFADTVDHRQFWDKTTGNLYWRFNGTHTVTDNIGTNYPALAQCTASDSFSLATPSTIFIDTDVANLPHLRLQSYFISNPNWNDSSQKVRMKLLNSDFTNFNDAIAFTDGRFALNNPTGALN